MLSANITAYRETDRYADSQTPHQPTGVHAYTFLLTCIPTEKHTHREPTHLQNYIARIHACIHAYRTT